MIPLWVQIVLALLLDMVAGDPRWLPHPVKGIGWLALALETLLRQRLQPRQAGVVAVVLVVTITTGLTWFVCAGAKKINPLFGDFISIILLYTCFAMHDLRYHALQVFRPLVTGDVDLARRRVAMLVGRDTENLDEGEITRAAVESVAENSVDGITAPLIFAFIAGAPGAMFYKAVNTLDSTFGYKNERYLQFGWMAARFDDLINFLPARITGLLVPFAARFLNLDGRRAWQMFKRDRHNHPSPNGGQIEAAFAGALGVQLGGTNYYGGDVSERPLMGDAQQSLRAVHIEQAVRLMVVTSLLVAAGGIVMSII